MTTLNSTVPREAQSVPGAGLVSSLLNRLGRPPVLILAFVLLGSLGCVAGYFQAGRAGDGIAEVAAPAAAASRPAAPASQPAADEVAKPGAARLGDSAAPAWPLWDYQLDEPLPARDPPLTPVDWRLLGATLSNGRWEVVVLRQDKREPDYFKVGDKLPGGMVVREITQENVTLSAGRRKIVLAYIGTR